MDYICSKTNPGNGRSSCTVMDAYSTVYPHNYAIFHSADDCF